MGAEASKPDDENLFHVPTEKQKQQLASAASLQRSQVESRGANKGASRPRVTRGPARSNNNPVDSTVLESLTLSYTSQDFEGGRGLLGPAQPRGGKLPLIDHSQRSNGVQHRHINTGRAQNTTGNEPVPRLERNLTIDSITSTHTDAMLTPRWAGVVPVGGYTGSGLLTSRETGHSTVRSYNQGGSGGGGLASHRTGGSTLQTQRSPSYQPATLRGRGSIGELEQPHPTTTEERAGETQPLQQQPKAPVAGFGARQADMKALQQQQQGSNHAPRVRMERNLTLVSLTSEA